MNIKEYLEGDIAAAAVTLFCPGKPPRGRTATFEPLLVDRAVDRVTDAVVDPANRDFAYTLFHADETAPEEIVAEAQTLPFLADKRVVVVRDAEKFDSESAAGPMLDYLASPNDATVLLLIANRIDRRTKFFKACQKSGCVVECPALNETEAMRWAKQEIEALGKSIDEPALRELIGRSGTHLSDVNNALTLLANFLGESEKRITDTDVISACADVAEEEIWALTDAIAASRPGEALDVLRRLLDMGKHPDEIIGTINWLLKSTYGVARNDPRVSRFVGQKVRPLAEKLGMEKLPAAFSLCTDSQFMMRNTGVDSELAIELLVLKLAAPVAPRRSA